MLLLIVLLVMVVAGALAWPVVHGWADRLLSPEAERRTVRREVDRHPRLARILGGRFDPAAATGLALSVAALIVVGGAIGFAVILIMVRQHAGFGGVDESGARFAASHATHGSTTALRYFTQLGGAVVLVPLSVVVWLLAARKRGWLMTFAFLVLTVGGQFAVADLTKWAVDRTRPNLDRLTGFSGPSFPSGHATASGACLAAFALLFGLGRSARVRATLAAVAVALACGIACSRVFLGVHWITDVIGGLILGWTWFVLCGIAFGGRILRFGTPAEEAGEELARQNARGRHRAA